MTTKTLGQVLYEADMRGRIADGPRQNRWQGCNQAQYERMASELAAVVREQCAQAAWAHYMDECKRKMVPPAEFGGWCAASAIRSMRRDKK